MAWCFAEQGKKVLLIDLDGQRANLTYICGIKKAPETNPTLKVLGVVLNKYTLRTLLSTKVTTTVDKMAAALGAKVFKTKIRQGVAMAENVGQHMGVTAYTPKSKCADDITNLCDEIKEVLSNG